MKYGYRNAQATVVAPTGTISFMMDADTTGIEPGFQLITVKNMVGGGTVVIPSQSVLRGLSRLGYSQLDIGSILMYLEENKTLEGCSLVKEEHLPVFDCASKCGDGSRFIKMMGHIDMVAAVQPLISGSISKTVNTPNDCTVAEYKDMYMKAWQKGLKCIAPYRDGCKGVQPLQSGKAQKSKDPIKRYKMGKTRLAITHKMEVGGFEGYLQVGLKNDFTPGEIFIRASKEGSTISGLLDAFATSISYNLQYGVPLQVLCRKFRNNRFDPAGVSSLGIVTSIVDYVFRWFEANFIDSDGNVIASSEILNIMVLNDELWGRVNNLSLKPSKVLPHLADPRKEYDGPLCDECGHISQRNGPTCWVCGNCGAKLGCS